MKEILEIVFFSKRKRFELIRERSGMFGVIKIVDGKEQPLYANKNFNIVQKYYNKIIGD